MCIGDFNRSGRFLHRRAAGLVQERTVMKRYSGRLVQEYMFLLKRQRFMRAQLSFS